jgi:molybdopterin-guanine dinucleotide biosynthesis protein A
MRRDRQSGELAPLVGGILVGGQSQRMGRAKALLEWRGSTFVERIADRLAAVVPEVVLLGSAACLPSRIAALPTIADAPGVRGPLAGLLAAFALRPDSAWLVLTCDQPCLTPATLNWLIAGRRRDRLAVLPRLVPARIEPFPGIYEPGCRPALATLATSEARGSLQPLAGLAGAAIVEVPAALAAELRGINTPEEWEALQRMPDAGAAAVRPPRRGGAGGISR